MDSVKNKTHIRKLTAQKSKKVKRLKETIKSLETKLQEAVQKKEQAEKICEFVMGVLQEMEQDFSTGKLIKTGVALENTKTISSLYH